MFSPFIVFTVIPYPFTTRGNAYPFPSKRTSAGQ